MQNHYEINVAKKFLGADGNIYYTHFFATAERSLSTLEGATAVYKELKKAFPEPDYQISVTHWEATGSGVII